MYIFLHSDNEMTGSNSVADSKTGCEIVQHLIELTFSTSTNDLSGSEGTKGASLMLFFDEL